MTREPDILQPGEPVVHDYRVLEHVHRSRNYDLYRVCRDGHQCLFAAKTLSPHAEDAAAAWWSLAHEGRLLCSLSHPHIVRGYQFFVRLHPVLIMESVQGTTLEEDLVADGPLDVEETARLALEIADALRYMHDQGLLHLDLSPDNVMREQGHAKLIDLSIARHPGPGVVGRGKRAFMAPEQVRGVNVTPATDIWGLGGLLFDCLTGRPPFVPDGERRTYEQLEHRADPIHEYNRDVPERLDEFVYRCLEPDPGDRPCLKDAVAILDHVLEEL